MSPTAFADIFSEFSAEDKQAFATYEWHCTECGSRTWLSPAGGSVDCACEPKDSGRNIHCYLIIGGKREHVGSALDFDPNGVLKVERERAAA